MAATDEVDIYNLKKKKNDINAFIMSNSTNFEVEDSFLDILNGCIVHKGWNRT